MSYATYYKVLQCAEPKRGKFLKAYPDFMVSSTAKNFIRLKVYILLSILVFKLFGLLEPYGILQQLCAKVGKRFARSLNKNEKKNFRF